MGKEVASRVYTGFSNHMQVAIESSHYRVGIYVVSESSIRFSCGKVIAEPKELVRIVKGTFFQEAVRLCSIEVENMRTENVLERFWK